MMKKMMIFALLCIFGAATMWAQDLDQQYGAKLLKPGTKAPDFSLLTADGKRIKLSEYRGKYVVLDFWASWCHDCRKDIPAVKELWNDFMDYNVRFIGVSFDTNKEAWVKTYWETYQMNWTQVSELKKWKKETFIDKLYNIEWIPTMYLIDPNGYIVLGTFMVDKMRAALEELRPKLALERDELTSKAVFGDGENTVENYIKQNQRYSVEANQMKIEAYAMATCNIEIDGSVTGVRVLEFGGMKANNPKFAKLKPQKQEALLKRAEQHFRNETIRLLQAMLKWKPATKFDRPVRDKVVLKVEFDPYVKRSFNRYFPKIKLK